jgi:hypothetical protein
LCAQNCKQTLRHSAKDFDLEGARVPRPLSNFLLSFYTCGPKPVEGLHCKIMLLKTCFVYSKMEVKNVLSIGRKVYFYKLKTKKVQFAEYFAFKEKQICITMTV